MISKDFVGEVALACCGRAYDLLDSMRELRHGGMVGRRTVGGHKFPT